MSGANGNPFAIENGADIVGMDAFKDERQDAFLFLGRADQAQAGNFQQALGAVSQKFLFVPGDAVDADVVDVFERRAQTDGAGDVRRARFEFLRQRGCRASSRR